MIAIGLVGAAGCRDRSAAPTGAAPAVDAAAAPRAALYGSGRCGECHVKMRNEWSASAHAQASRSPLYRAALAESSERTVCQRCHEPVDALVEHDDPVAGEGVTCDACHIVKSVALRADGATLELRPAENIKYGPLCDAKNHYFHKMGCSPLHESSQLCAGCHQWVRGALPVFTEYDEWAHSAAAADGVECQGCHMPTSRAEVAEGAGPRPSVPSHGFLGRGQELRRGAVELGLTARGAGSRVDVAATLRTKGGGHRVPTGLPEHRLILVLRLVDGDGRELAHDERSYGRRLVDAHDAAAPFWKATRVAADNRLGADEARVESWKATASGAREARAELWWQERAGELAPALGGVGARELVASERVAVRR